VFDLWVGLSAVALVCHTGYVRDDGIGGLRNEVRAPPLVRANGQAAVWLRIGLTSVVEEPIVISFDYASFRDYWSSFSTGPTRIAQRLLTLPSTLRSEIEGHVRDGYLAGLPDGPRSFAIIV